tara:strand:- start:3904 stop:4554 length:651 start_codon:yes stop_codon:yes gene_type:complete
MSNLLVLTFRDLWYFIKKPVELKQVRIPLKVKIGTCLALFIIQIPPLLGLSALLGGLEILGLWEDDMHRLQKIFKEMKPGLIFFFAVIIAPFLEEIMFRLGLKLRSNFLILWPLQLLILLQVSNKINLLKTIRNFWNKFYAWIFYLITIAFGLIHILNFKPSLNIYLLAPVLVAPQILIGINLGYLRIRFGLIWSILFHAFYNGILLSIALLTGEI